MNIQSSESPNVLLTTIDEVSEHPNADRLELATVKGWQCVIQKGQFQKGDKCVYIPIDSVLPQKVEELIFPSDSKVKLSKSRVKTIRLRGAISQGLVVALETLPDTSFASLSSQEVGTDVSSLLGIVKYTPPDIGSPQRNSVSVSKKKSNPNFQMYTKLQNIKWYPELFKEGEEVVITEKIHGTNFRAGWVPTHCNTLWKRFLRFVGLLPPWEFVYGSHKVQLQDKPNAATFYESNVYLEAVNKYNLKERIPKGLVLYGEIYGDGIQKGYSYGCQKGEHNLVIFDILDHRNTNPLHLPTYLSHYEVEITSKLFNLPLLVPTLYKGPYSPEKVQELVKGHSWLHSSQKIKEGVVVRPSEEAHCYMGRKVLKVINEDYLLEDNSEYH